jgi:hypothetical protein
MTTSSGAPRVSTTRSRVCTTRAPGNEVSTALANAFRLNSSMRLNTRKARPVVNWSGGSFNYTGPANQFNDENLFIIRHAAVAQHFRAEVDRVFQNLAADF